MSEDKTVRLIVGGHLNTDGLSTFGWALGGTFKAAVVIGAAAVFGGAIKDGLTNLGSSIERAAVIEAGQESPAP